MTHNKILYVPVSIFFGIAIFYSYHSKNTPQVNSTSLNYGPLAIEPTRRVQEIAQLIDKKSAQENNIESILQLSEKSPNRALIKFLSDVCQPSFQEAQRHSEIDIYYTAKYLAEKCNAKNSDECLKILNHSADQDIRSALIWGFASSLIKSGNSAEAKAMFNSLSMSDKESSANNFFVELTHADPLEAAKFVANQKMKGEGLEAVMQVWAQSDWNEALNWLNSYVDSKERAKYMERMAISVGELDSVEITNFLLQASANQIESLKVKIAEVKMGSGLSKGAEWLVSNLDQSGIDKYLGKAVLLKMGDDLLLAEKWSQYLSGEAKNKVDFELGKQNFLTGGAENSLEWLKIKNSQSNSIFAYNGIISAWVGVNPEAAFEFANNSESYELQDTVILSMVNSMISKKMMDEEKFKWLTSCKLEQTSANEALRLLSRDNINYAARLATELPDPDEMVIRNIADNLAKNDGEFAAKWATGIKGEGREGAIFDVVSIWSTTHPSETISWICNDLDPQLIDGAIWACIPNLEKAKPEIKKSYLFMIGDPKKRRQAADMLKIK